MAAVAEKVSVDTIRDQLQTKTAAFMTSMVGDSDYRVQNYINDWKLLNQGIYYPVEYHAFLQAAKKPIRIKSLIRIDAFLLGYVNPKLFDIQTGDQDKRTFVVKKGVLPNEALHNIVEVTPSLLGCAEVCQLAQYLAIESILGKEKFNALFSRDSKTPLCIGSTCSLTQLRNYFDAPEKMDYNLGDLVYFSNANSYLNKHVRGCASGFNSICIDASKQNEKFVALGPPSCGLSHEEFSERLRLRYNDAPCSLDHLSPECQTAYAEQLLLAEKYEGVQLDRESFEEQGGGKATIVCELDAAKITLLANSSVKKACQHMNGFKISKGVARS